MDPCDNAEVDIAAGALFVRDQDVLGANVGDDYVLLSPDLDYVGLDTVATRIWALLTEPRTPDEIVAILIREYDVAEEACRADVAAFLQQLLDFKVVKLAT